MMRKPKARPEKQLEHPEQKNPDNVIEPPGPHEKPPDVLYPGQQEKKEIKRARKEE